MVRETLALEIIITKNAKAMLFKQGFSPTQYVNLEGWNVIQMSSEANVFLKH